MKNYELLPTEENLIDCLYRDSINRNKDIAYFYNILQAQESMTTIAIDGRWGSGKTFFVRQTKLVLNALNPTCGMDDKLKSKIIDRILLFQDGENKENDSIAIYYDAWKNDNDTDPIFSLIYEIIKQLNIDFSLSSMDVIKLAGSIVEMITGHNINNIKDIFTSDDPFTKFKEQKSIESKIQEFFTEILAERGNRLVIFIDELDRCKPTFAVQFLEQIKHYVFDDRITFVFSINLEQLQHTIKQYYGLNFDSYRYLDKFFDLRISLPPADMNKFYQQIGFESESSYYVDSVVKRVIQMFNFELREISKFYSQVKSAVYDGARDSGYNYSFPDQKGKQIIMMYIVPLLIGLKIANISKYDNFINGRDSEPLIELFDIDKDASILENMLNRGESFEQKEGKKLVTYEDIIKHFYDAIFVTNYNNRIYETRLGQYEFSKESKIFAISVSNMMSPIAVL